jgi:hypothetical protein
MRISELLRSSVFSALVAIATFGGTLGAAGQAMAFDDKVFDDKTGVKPQSSPWLLRLQERPQGAGGGSL